MKNQKEYDANNLTPAERLRLYPEPESALLIYGPSGSGKTHLAETLINDWNLEKHRYDRVIVFDCSPFVGDAAQLHATLFGYVRGAFTGGDRDTPGILDSVDSGRVLVLDEIGSVPPQLQGMLRRLIKERKFRPMGAGAREKEFFGKIIATTLHHKNLTHDLFRRFDMKVRMKGWSEKNFGERAHFVSCFFAHRFPEHTLAKSAKEFITRIEGLQGGHDVAVILDAARRLEPKRTRITCDAVQFAFHTVCADCFEDTLGSAHGAMPSLSGRNAGE